MAFCGSGGGASATFSWQPGDEAVEVWLDISEGNEAFAAGSFAAAGPFLPGVRSYTWTALKPGAVYFARINSRSASGWLPSQTLAFVPCGAPAMLASSQTCIGPGAAAATFRWAPASPPATQQQIEAGTDGSFAAGSFRSSGPLRPAVDRFELTGLRPDVPNYFRVSALLPDGNWRRSQVQYFTAGCSSSPDVLRPTGDRLVYQRLRINAPVNMRSVGPDGVLGNPEWKDDVVRYDFSPYTGVGGSPGAGGTSVIAGHLDVQPNYQAVFWDLAKAQPGDIIDYHRADGQRFSYRVSWAAAVPFDEQMNQYFASTSPETMILITCNGTFDQRARNYDKRILVYAVAVQ
jgi:LPXTG-site transpeptidase (sortase) family protein